MENQAKSFCLTENARRASLIALIFAPLLVLVSGALRNQQADNLLPAFFSTDSLSWFYWDQSRYGSIHSLLAFPIQNIRMNLLFQLYLRAASLVFLVVWIVESCIRNDSVNSAKHIQRFFGLAFVAAFLLTFQEAGDALIYGANAHPIAIPFAILALSVNFGKSKCRFTVLKTSLMVIWVSVFWGIAIWTSIFTALWAPALVLLQFAYISKSERVFQTKFASWFALNVVVVGTLIGVTSPPNSFLQLNNPNTKISPNNFFIDSSLMLKKLFVRCLFLSNFGFVTFDNRLMVGQTHHLLPILFHLYLIYVKESHP